MVSLLDLDAPTGYICTIVEHKRDNDLCILDRLLQFEKLFPEFIPSGGLGSERCFGQGSGYRQ